MTRKIKDMNFREYTGKILALTQGDRNKKYDSIYSFVVVDAERGLVMQVLEDSHCNKSGSTKVRILEYSEFKDFTVEILEDNEEFHDLIEKANAYYDTWKPGVIKVLECSELDSFRKEGDPNVLHFIRRTKDGNLEDLWGRVFDYMEDDDLIVVTLNEDSLEDEKLTKGTLVVLRFHNNSLYMDGVADLAFVKDINVIDRVGAELDRLREDYVICSKAFEAVFRNVYVTLEKMLIGFGLSYKNIKYISNIMCTSKAALMLMKILSNNKDFEYEDIYRQAMVISGEKTTPKFEKAPKIDFSFKERHFIKKFYFPFDLEKGASCEEIYYAVTTLECYRDERHVMKHKKALINSIIDKIAPPIPDSEVKEIHIYCENTDTSERIFLDMYGVHEIMGDKVKLQLKDGQEKIGYVSPETCDETCISLFENYDEDKGFFEHHSYKIEDVVHIDAKRSGKSRWEETIDFEF